MIPVLPGTLRDLLAVGMSVTEHTDWLHAEHDPETWRPRGGMVHAHASDFVGVVSVGLRGQPDGMALDTLVVDTIHDCDDEHCLYRPQIARAADVRYTARWCLRVVGRGTGRLTDHDRRLIAIAVALHMKAIA